MNECTGFLTAAEVMAAQALPKGTPYAITGVSSGMFSLARRFGGITLQGMHYTYIDEHDELVRDDVLRMVRKMRRTRPAVPKGEQLDLWKAT